MLASEIKAFIQNFPNAYKHLRDICSIDTIPTGLSEHQYVIVNTECVLFCVQIFCFSLFQGLLIISN
jgi:hypothetical protein